MGASRVDLNSQDSVVPVSEPRVLGLQPSSEYCEDEDDEGKSRRCSRGGRSVRCGSTCSPSHEGGESPSLRGSGDEQPPSLGDEGYSGRGGFSPLRGSPGDCPFSSSGWLEAERRSALGSVITLSWTRSRGFSYSL